MKFNYLLDLGYSTEEIEDYSNHWNPGIIEFLLENAENVSKNMSYLLSYFSKDFVLRLTIFYPDSFSISPECFQDRICALQQAFPEEWKEIIEKQFWGYNGIPGSNYKPFLYTVGVYDDAVYKNAIEMLQNPERIVFEFMVLLSRDVGIEVLADSFFEDDLWNLECSKYEVVRNAKHLISEGLTLCMVEDMLYNAPYLMMLSEIEITERLKKAFGEEYIAEMKEMDDDSFLDKLEEIAW